MIAKMKFINMVGPKEDLDMVVEKYLGKYEIQLENTMVALKELANVTPCVESNPYKELLAKAEELAAMTKREDPLKKTFDRKQAVSIIESFEGKRETYRQEKEALEAKKQEIGQALQDVVPYRNINHDIREILDFHYVKFRFGKIPVEFYEKLEKYVYEELSTIFYKCQSDKEYIWGVYFVPVSEAEKVDAVYASLHFERFRMPKGYEGTLEEAYETLIRRLKKTESALLALEAKMGEELASNVEDIYAAKDELETLCDNFEVRKLAAYTHTNDKTFFILCGWMTKEDAEKFEREVNDDPHVYCTIEEGHESRIAKPPTKLKNPKLFKPFEMFIRMYGLPDYNEFDPTIFVAVTYSFIFGAMFGDVGQGACLLTGGLLLYKFKNLRLAGIVGVAGIWSVIFGFLYGSVFGFEEVLPALWMKPMDNIMNTLMLAIGFGAGLILLAMILNIINAIRAKEYGRLLFNQSGIAGIVCYGFVVLCALLFLSGHGLPATVLICIAVGIPLTAILLKEPLSHLVEKKSKIFPEGSKVMFFVEALVEGFDVVLSYATNTISFVRVGAFALSHAGMMGVVMTLAGLEKGSPNWLIIVLGNLLVAGLEGLIVGIQVLRLEYYEMFSRFYSGSGKPFVSFKKRNQ